MVKRKTHLTRGDARAELGVGVKALNEWITKGLLRPDVVGGDRIILFLPETVEAFKSSRTYKDYVRPKGEPLWVSTMYPGGCSNCHRTNVKHYSCGQCRTCFIDPNVVTPPPSRNNGYSVGRLLDTTVAVDEGQGTFADEALAQRIADLIMSRVSEDVHLQVRSALDAYFEVSMSETETVTAGEFTEMMVGECQHLREVFTHGQRVCGRCGASL